MAVASLLDAGADEKVLLEVLKTIPAHGFDIKNKQSKQVRS